MSPPSAEHSLRHVRAKRLRASRIPGSLMLLVYIVVMLPQRMLTSPTRPTTPPLTIPLFALDYYSIEALMLMLYGTLTV